MYLIDANVLIRAHGDFYPIDRVPQFWAWLVEQGQQDNVKIPPEIYDEITVGDDALANWAKEADVKAALLLDETPDPALVQQVLVEGYEGDDPEFTDVDVQKIGRDAFIVAYALAQAGRVVVTKEVSASSKRRGNRKMPDACNDCGVDWTNDFEMYRLLNFNLSGR
ncbi:DUF4411 family protein [Paracoccus salsus]|uniref:DUF4411 family protein n=1 Tax=Paracoccus salsus TaxID=2911061 RepID=UPI001F1FDE7F|nr:DUF4411 family protein [Paracoccus salsus]MCF3973927.1 DUF4411 family protein [Paracoccus salsus]